MICNNPNDIEQKHDGQPKSNIAPTFSKRGYKYYGATIGRFIDNSDSFVLMAHF